MPSVYTFLHSVLCTTYRTALQVPSVLPAVSVFQTEQAMNVYSYSMAPSELLFGPIGHMNPSFLQYSIPFKKLKCSVSHFFMHHLKMTHRYYEFQ